MTVSIGSLVSTNFSQPFLDCLNNNIQSQCTENNNESVIPFLITLAVFFVVAAGGMCIYIRNKEKCDDLLRGCKTSIRDKCVGLGERTHLLKNSAASSESTTNK